MSTSTKLNRRERKAQQLLAHYTRCEALARHLGHSSPDGKKISVALFKLERRGQKHGERLEREN